MAFALGEDASPVGTAERARTLGHGIGRELALLGPPDWVEVEAGFAFTTTAESAVVVFTDEQRRLVRVQPSDKVLALVREHRHVSAQLGDGPWWRMELALSRAGEIDIDYDYGDEPFPDDQLFAADVYRADLETYPRSSLPVWLAAYVAHGGRQSRRADVAAARARADRASGVRAALSEQDFPAFPVMSARWAVIAAAFVAVRSRWGPRVLPSVRWFEGAKRSGSTLYALPGGRAVLSGGVWNAPELDAMYNRGAPMPELYAGAPDWVADPVLNPRAVTGLLTFCYWWEGGRWYRGASPPASELAVAVPGIWSSETVIDVVTGLVASDPNERQVAAVTTLVSAAEVGVVTRETLVDVFGSAADFDVDSAFYQLVMAGVTLRVPEPMPRDEAIALVREFVVRKDLDTTGYPLDNLRAERIGVGWMVHVPTAPGEIALGRAIFYIADDGVLEQSSSSVAPSAFAAEFERRFQLRHGGMEI
ncbi:hypothetical protein IT779_15080 [Nocardia sp. NEAU-351]|uniref:Uncharacterized protein n=1 Tax=Nocardia bovistercoris TaxID=2785916 RepID=A0A931IBW2_9NOCA|nr:hypothetical protein [Nocardia bovistercoris]